MKSMFTTWFLGLKHLSRPPLTLPSPHLSTHKAQTLLKVSPGLLLQPPGWSLAFTLPLQTLLTVAGRGAHAPAQNLSVVPEASPESPPGPARPAHHALAPSSSLFSSLRSSHDFWGFPTSSHARASGLSHLPLGVLHTHFPQT